MKTFANIMSLLLLQVKTITPDGNSNSVMLMLHCNIKVNSK